MSFQQTGPRYTPASHWGRLDPVILEYATDRSAPHVEIHIHQSALDSCVTPAWIVGRQSRPGPDREDGETRKGGGAKLVSLVEPWRFPQHAAALELQRVRGRCRGSSFFYFGFASAAEPFALDAAF